MSETTAVNSKRAPSKPPMTDEQLLAITDDQSQPFADLAMAEKIRWYRLENQRLAHKNKELTAKAADSDGLRITEKGVLSLSVPNSWPASYYRDQWEYILSKVAAIQAKLEQDAAGEGKIINKPPKEKEKK